jgi:hypothetical protein
MPFRDDRDHIDREILDIIPERFDADPDSHYARKTALIRTILTISLVVLAVAALGAATRYIFFPVKPKMQAESGVPLITADDKPIKTKPGPEERGGMDVPNRDKLVYEKMGSSQESEPQSERLLPPPEVPAAPPVQPRSPSIKPAFQTPPPKEINTANLPPEPAKPAKPVPGTTANQAMPMAPALSAPAPAPMAKAAKAAPAPAAKVAPAAAAPIVLHPPGGSAWHVQLGSLKSEADGKAEWTHIHSTNKDVLGSYSGEVVRTDLGAKGIYWRIYAGPMDEAKARTVCAQLAKRNQGCIIGKE